MTLLDVRALLDFTRGDNSSDTIVEGVHLNLTALNYWNYTLFDNGTISNGSWCFLTFKPYTPALVIPNGTFVNATWCETAIKPVGTRGHIGVAFACLYGLTLVFTLINLTKHGKLYLPVEKRFYPIGRRWQWYWALFVAAAALIALFTGIDVDRYYITSIPLILNNFFWYLMQMGTIALVWEAVRHWGSWMERQFVDPNPFVLHQEDKRARFELLLPLFFYFWIWLNFFLIVPRNWGNIELQRSPEQTAMFARPAATDIRFKLATFSLFISWATILVSMWHSIRHYEDRNRGLLNRIVGGLGHMPFRFVLLLPLSMVVIGYQGLAAWDFDLSPQKQDTNYIAMYVGGYTPALLIIIIQIVSGFMRPNEDKALIQQRRERGAAADAQLGVVRKPAWWKRINGEFGSGNMRDRIMRNVREVGGGRATAQNVQAAATTRANEAEAASRAAPIEMNELRRTGSVSSSVRTNSQAPPPYTAYSGRSEARRSERTAQMAAGLLFPNAAPQPAPPDTERGRSELQSSPPSYRPGVNERSGSTNSGTSLAGPPQQVRSMLDI